MQTYRPVRRYVEPTPAYRLARRLEERLEFAPFPLSRLPHSHGLDVLLNPVRRLPRCRRPAAPGRRYEPTRWTSSLPLGERVGHSLVLGTARGGRDATVAELFVTRDIRRRHRTSARS